MNICLVNNVFPPILTGSSLFTQDLAIQLAQAGHHIIVISAKTHRDSPDLENHEKGFTVYRLDRLRLFRSNLWMNFPNFYLTLFPSNYKKYRDILREHKIEVIHQCNNIFDLVFMSAYYARKLRIPLICSLTTQIQHSNKVLNKILELFDKTVVKKFFADHVDCFITGDKETARYVSDRYKRYRGFETIHYGISGLELFSSIRRDYSSNTKTLVSLGHISFVKDRKELIQAWPLVMMEYPKAKLVIIGSLFRNDIKRLISKLGIESNVVFTGGVDREKIPGLIESAELGCMFFSNMPYCRGVGSANIELMASGLPVILDADDDNFGPMMPFRDGIHFIKLKKRDPVWLATKIIELFGDSELRQNIGTAGREFVTTQLNWEKVLPLMEDLYIRFSSAGNGPCK